MPDGRGSRNDREYAQRPSRGQGDQCVHDSRGATESSVGGQVDDAVVRLRVFGDALVPEDVTVILRHQPTKAWRKGETRTSVGRHPLLAKDGAWLLDSELPNSVPVDAQISSLLAAVTSDVTAWHTLHQQYEVDIRCGIFLTGDDQSFHLPADLVSDLATRGLRLEFDIYAGLEDEG